MLVVSEFIRSLLISLDLVRNLLFDFNKRQHCTPISPLRDTGKRFSSGVQKIGVRIRTSAAEIAPFDSPLLQHFSLPQSPVNRLRCRPRPPSLVILHSALRQDLEMSPEQR